MMTLPIFCQQPLPAGAEAGDGFIGGQCWTSCNRHVNSFAINAVGAGTVSTILGISDSTFTRSTSARNDRPMRCRSTGSSDLRMSPMATAARPSWAASDLAARAMFWLARVPGAPSDVFLDEVRAPRRPSAEWPQPGLRCTGRVPAASETLPHGRHEFQQFHRGNTRSNSTLPAPVDCRTTADFLVVGQVGHHDREHEAVLLGLGQGIRALLLHRVLRSQHVERLGQRVASCPPIVTCFSCMTSSSAAWVLGGVRLISSAMSRFVNTGPLTNFVKRRPVVWSSSRISVPVMSEGIRSGRELDAFEVHVENASQGGDQDRLGGAGRAKEHAMATGKEAGQDLLDRLVLADNYLLDFPDDCLPSGLETFKSGLEIATGLRCASGHGSCWG